eukprot:scaffold87865_cov64-Cyclotella_meneghiniana.AAC.2
MPALTIFRNFTTRPFAGDDVHIVCILLGFYRIIQFICIIGLVVITWLDHISGNTLLINGIPYHCPQFDATYLNFTTASSLQLSEENDDGQSLDTTNNSIEFKNMGYNVFYLSTASLYLVGEMVWLIMVWSVASIGTPTEPGRRDKYLRNLIKVKMFATSIIPIALVAFGIVSIHYFRHNNYGCGNDVPDQSTTIRSRTVQSIVSVLVVTYALELLQHLTRGKAGDMYVGLRMLARVQAERRVDAIKTMAEKSKSLPRGEFQMKRRRSAIEILEANDSGDYKIDERQLLVDTNDEDQCLMDDAAYYSKYASYIYVKLRNIVTDVFMIDEEVKRFIRPLEDLYRCDYSLESVGLNNSFMCYANFENGIAETPYAIIIDKAVEKIVIVIRGTRSLEDLVLDLQFNPESLANIGKVCGFRGEGYYCHQGFLFRSMWIYNDLKSQRTLKNLYSQDSPYSNYPLCFAYEPPGCVFDLELAKLTKDFIVSFVRNDDLVPRLSYHNVDKARDEFYNILARIKVPKIQLYFDLKAECSDESVAQRNAKVLKRKRLISTETEFYRKLKEFRFERSEKTRVGVNSIRLFLPGKVIHLVDMKGDNGASSYVPYYARRHQFNQVVMSDRMISDHDIHYLVDILENTRLCGDFKVISTAFMSTPFILDDEEDPDVDIRLFMCCSNPYGKIPVLMSLLTTIALALTLASHLGCRMYISTHPDLPEGWRISHGLYTYSFVQCTSADAMCDSLKEYDRVGDW